MLNKDFKFGVGSYLNIYNMKNYLTLFTVVLLFLNTDIIAQWQTNGSNIYFNTGNIGMGNDSPDSKLEITPENSFNITTTNLQNGKAPLKVAEEGSYGRAILIDANQIEQMNEDAQLYINAVSSATTIINKGGGNVGIGTNDTPTEKLEVLGKIKSSGENSALILVSPDGTEWEITVDNLGNLSTNQVSSKIIEYENDNINIFPNPFNNEITIDIKSSKITNMSIEILDINGKLLYFKSYNSNKIILHLDDFKNGIYILNVNNNNNVIVKTQKVIKK